MPPRSILFIGNSFTARNDVPGMLAAMAAARGHRLTHKLLSIGGASLRTHYNKGDALRDIASGRYDTVVLQEQSTLPVKNAARMHESIRDFAAPVREAGATMVLYLTWARRHSPHHQQLITDAYTSIGRELNATVIPAGLAWQRILSEHPEITLHDKDQSHPTLAGSYLAACTFFATLYDESPEGLPAPKSLESSLAPILQRAARDAARAPLSAPQPTPSTRPAPKSATGTSRSRTKPMASAKRAPGSRTGTRKPRP
jgi:hypothetical protein